jgi:hypothetical protein
VGQAGSEYGQHLLADLGAILPQADKPSDEFFSGPVAGVGDAVEHGGGIRWRLERGGKEPVLVAEVVVDERRVDISLGGYDAHGGALKSPFREQFPGGVQDGPARVRAAQRAAAPGGH